MVKVLVANKIDQDGQLDSDGNQLRKVTREMGEQMAKESGMKYLEASAFTGDGVEEVFFGTASKYIEKIVEKEQER